MGTSWILVNLGDNYDWIQTCWILYLGSWRSLISNSIFNFWRLKSDDKVWSFSCSNRTVDYWRLKKRDSIYCKVMSLLLLFQDIALQLYSFDSVKIWWEDLRKSMPIWILTGLQSKKHHYWAKDKIHVWRIWSCCFIQNCENRLQQCTRK